MTLINNIFLLILQLGDLLNKTDSGRPLWEAFANEELEIFTETRLTEKEGAGENTGTSEIMNLMREVHNINNNSFS